MQVGAGTCQEDEVYSALLMMHPAAAVQASCLAGQLPRLPLVANAADQQVR